MQRIIGVVFPSHTFGGARDVSHQVLASPWTHAAIPQLCANLLISFSFAFHSTIMKVKVKSMDITELKYPREMRDNPRH